MARLTLSVRWREVGFAPVVVFPASCWLGRFIVGRESVFDDEGPGLLGEEKLRREFARTREEEIREHPLYATNAYFLSARILG